MQPSCTHRPWQHRLVLALTSVGGLGYLPLAPGTWGTLAALPLWWAMSDLGLPAFAALTTLAVLGAIALAGAAERIYGDHDVQHIVLDEVVGLLCTVLAVPWRPQLILPAFVLFRLLDALKPPPISWIDREMPGGAGVVLDDVAAGLIGCAILHAVRSFNGGWW